MTFQNICEKGGLDISHKKGGAGKIDGVALKKGVSLIFTLTNRLYCYLSLSVWCACVGLVYYHHFYQYFLCFGGKT